MQERAFVLHKCNRDVSLAKDCIKNVEVRKSIGAKKSIAVKNGMHSSDMWKKINKTNIPSANERL